jgi:hypothetical protein
VSAAALRRPVRELLRRGLHEVAGGANKRSTQFPVERQLCTPHGVDYDASRIWGVPDLKLELGIERHPAKGRAFKADISPLAIGQPRHMIGWTDMHVIGRQRHVQLAGDGLRLRDLF